MIMLYAVCLVISVLLLVWLHLTDVRESPKQYTMVLLMIVSNLGYLFMSVSTNLDEAILANRFVYIGSCYLSMVYFFVVCDICHIKLPRVVTIILAGIQSFIYMCVCFVGVSDLYYKSVQLVHRNGVSYLVKEYGPVHTLLPVMLTVYELLCVILAVMAYKKKKSVDIRDVVLLVVFSLAALSVYIIEKVFALEYEFVPISNILLMLSAFFPIYNSNLFTVYENKEIVGEQLDKLGFVTFDRNMRYKGCNDFALSVFPEFSECSIGKKVSLPSDEIVKSIIVPVRNFSEQYKREGTECHRHMRLQGFKMHGRSYDLYVHTILDMFGKCAGYTVQFEDETEHYEAVRIIENYSISLSKEVEEKTAKIRDMQQRTILGMAQMVESRDLSTGGHIRRTSDVVRIFSKKLLASELGFSKDFLDLVIRSAPMHDLGKIGVDDAILRKQGRFTDEEYEKMKTHSEIGAKMVSDILTGVEEDRFVEIATNVAHYHHEKVNGKGYPCGISGDDIPVEARIMALADVFDALVSKRCYKDAFSYDQAFDIIEKDSGTHFDAQLASIFISCRPELEEYYNKS